MIVHWILGLTLLFSAVAEAEVEVVPRVEFSKYAGRWFEIASIPQFFQRKCVADVSAEYTLLADGLVRVVNQCRTADGSMSSVEGRARVVDPAVPAKLEVTFVKLLGWIFALGGKYWIIDLEKDYRYAVIGHPARRYAWILSRAPTLPAADLETIAANLKRQGYDLCDLRTTAQGEAPRERRPFCEALR